MIWLRFSYEIGTNYSAEEAAGRLLYVLEDYEHYHIISASEKRIDFAGGISRYLSEHTLDDLNKMETGFITLNNDTDGLNRTVVRLFFRVDLVIWISLAAIFSCAIIYLSLQFLILLLALVWVFFHRLKKKKTNAQNLLYNALDPR